MRHDQHIRLGSALRWRRSDNTASATSNRHQLHTLVRGPAVARVRDLPDRQFVMSAAQHFHNSATDVALPMCL